MPSEPTVLADRYQLSRKLGAGPIGEVWEARDLVLGQPVAVKMVHDHLAAVEAFRARFRSLARDAARIQHPNVAAMHDIDEDGNFIVTELVEGPSARQLLAEQGTLPLETATRLAAGACSALSAAHAAGALHRGLKPENLLATPDGAVKVTDFGIARAGLDPGLATVRYLAPEELATGQVDDRSDLYALGCCLYELLCGQPPFDGPTPLAVTAGHLAGRPRRPSSIRADIPEQLEAVIVTALARDPGDRYQTPTELRQALRRAVARLQPPASATAEPVVAITLGPAAAAPAPPATPTSAPGDGGGAAPVDAQAEGDGSAQAPAARAVGEGGGPAGRNRLLAVLLAVLVAVGLVAGLVAVLVATRPSRQVAAPAGAGSTTTLRPASAVSAATSPARLVPVVAGATQAEAAERLHHAGTPVGAVRRVRSDKVPRGRAVGTKPPAGTDLQPGQRVALLVSSGAGPDSVADLVTLIDADPRAAGPRAPTFRGRLAGLDDLSGRRRQAELADLLGIAEAGAGNGDFSRQFSAAAVQVLGPRVGVDELVALVDLLPEAAGPRGPRFGGRLAGLEARRGARRQAEAAELLAIARAGAGNGDFTPKFSAAAVLVLSRLA
jgi:eukaryotic-like serine/threonine-protein kinase